MPCVSADKVQPKSSDIFRAVVIGEFSRGKSSFINALLGQRILPSKMTPCTSITTTVMYGDVLEYRIYLKGESVPRQISQDEFFAIIECNDASFVEHAEIICPNVFCKDNVEVVDTPATNVLNMKRMEFINQADAVVMMLSAEQPLSASETKFIQKYFHGDIGKKTVFVIGFKDRLADVEDEKYVIDFVTRILRATLPNFNLQNKIFLVDSYGALCFRRHEHGEELFGRQAGHIPNNFNDTGFPAVEKALKNLIYNKRNKKIICDTVNGKSIKHNNSSTWGRRSWK